MSDAKTSAADTIASDAPQAPNSEHQRAAPPEDLVQLSSEADSPSPPGTRATFSNSEERVNTPEMHAAPVCSADESDSIGVDDFAEQKEEPLVLMEQVEQVGPSDTEVAGELEREISSTQDVLENNEEYYSGERKDEAAEENIHYDSSEYDMHPDEMAKVDEVGSGDFAKEAQRAEERSTQLEEELVVGDEEIGLDFYCGNSEAKSSWEVQKTTCSICKTLLGWSRFRPTHHCRQCGCTVCGPCSRQRR